jgi:hypothetical protein
MIDHSNTCKNIHVKYRSNLGQNPLKSDITSSFWPTHTLCACFTVIKVWPFKMTFRNRKEVLSQTSEMNYVTWMLVLTHVISHVWDLTLTFWNLGQRTNMNLFPDSLGMTSNTQWIEGYTQGIKKCVLIWPFTYISRPNWHCFFDMNYITCVETIIHANNMFYNNYIH